MPSLSYRVTGATELMNWLNKSKTVLTKAERDMIQQIISDGVNYMQMKAPVDTGYLKAHISGYVTGKGSGVINSSAYYSGFVNYGTRYMDAQPYFSDGVTYMLDRIQRLIQDQILAQMRH